MKDSQLAVLKELHKDPDLLKELTLKIASEKIDCVLGGFEQKVELFGVAPDDIIGYLQSEYNAIEISSESNGWEWNFFSYLDIGDSQYCFSYIGFYGNSTFSFVE